jgi:hypothetical protein
MIEYVEQSGNFDFKTLKPIREVFGPILKALEFLNDPVKKQGTDLPHELAILLSLYYDWVNNEYNEDYEPIFKLYVSKKASLHNNIPVLQLLRLDAQIGTQKYKYMYDKLLERNEEDTSNFTIIGTAHSFKGFTVDEVYIDKGFQEYLRKTVMDDGQILQNLTELKTLSVSDKAKQEWLLYYVACTRATKKITGYTEPLELSLKDLAKMFTELPANYNKQMPAKTFNLYNEI